jgi:asparaginyl-tRNA synthetase
MSELKKEAVISEIFRAARDWLYEHDYTEVTVPRIVRASGACENVNTLYNVTANGNEKWHGRTAYLAQTGQLYLESLVPRLGRVFCDGPSFRAEEDVDARHLTEFRMIEIELPTDFDGLLHQLQGFINHIVSHIIYKNESKKLGIREDRVNQLKKIPRIFTQITYDEAITKLQEHGYDLKWGDDLKHVHELKLVELYENQPVFITRFPDPMEKREKEIEVEKFFNMIPDPEKKGRVLSCDCILPFSGESIGAAARIYNAEILSQRLRNSKMFKRLEALGGSIEDFDWYINKLKEGSLPHAGCGFGMARIVQFILGEDDIRDSVNFVSNKEVLI